MFCFIKKESKIWYEKNNGNVKIAHKIVLIKRGPKLMKNACRKFLVGSCKTNPAVEDT